MDPIQEKLARIAGESPPRVLDLFAGCGGLSLGFHAAGYELVGAVEYDKHAAASHGLNFFPDGPHSDSHSQARDVREIEPEELLEELGLDGRPELQIDVIVGGPPCQAFARVGRAKLREVADHPKAFIQDARSNLYLRYLHYVRRLRPLGLVMENVPDVMNFGGHNIYEEICEVLEDEGYECAYTLLNAAFFGVPQMRERAFLVAVRKELGRSPSFPEPSHSIELPAGYEGTRSVALKTVQNGLFTGPTRYVSRPCSVNGLKPAVTAEEALGDLPRITKHLRGELKRGPRRFNELWPYPGDVALSSFAALMRTWPGFKAGEGIFDHAIRYLPRDYKIFREMNPGDQYPEALEHARRLLSQKLGTLENPPAEGTEEFRKLRAEFVPPYDPTKFPNKWRKMEPDFPARTLMAHLGKDSYSHIHYDSTQARTISVREAARLQSFPDGFVFSGTMNPAFRQIGNAVPPLLANAVAAELGAALAFRTAHRLLLGKDHEQDAQRKAS